MLKDETWVCKSCCASNVQEQVWVELNSYQGHKATVVDECGDLFFCPECGLNVEVVQYCDFAVEDDTEQAENNRLSQIMSEADVAMNRNIKRQTERRDK
tara:strand:+ start:1792 stop:2088 length:297 start_codon:yes stop_codon:yes gene_type:complete